MKNAQLTNTCKYYNETRNHCQVWIYFVKFSRDIKTTKQYALGYNVNQCAILKFRNCTWKWTTWIKQEHNLRVSTSVNSCYFLVTNSATTLTWCQDVGSTERLKDRARIFPWAKRICHSTVSPWLGNSLLNLRSCLCVAPGYPQLTRAYITEICVGDIFQNPPQEIVLLSTPNVIIVRTRGTQ